MYYLRKYFVKTYKYGNIEEFSFYPLSHSEIVEVFNASKVILDINHPQQYGLTMRTFECLGAKKKLITTNQSVKNYDFYNENNILVVDRNNITIDAQFFKTPYKDLDSRIYEKYSLKNWLNVIFKKVEY